ncbi:UNVERIFIED_CONTAM: hypothetical protein FKN15_001184 [Acipenser sinensis]
MTIIVIKSKFAHFTEFLAEKDQPKVYVQRNPESSPTVCRCHMFCPQVLLYAGFISCRPV